MERVAYGGGERGQGRAAPEGSLDPVVQVETRPYASRGPDSLGPGPHRWNEAAGLGIYLEIAELRADRAARVKVLSSLVLTSCPTARDLVGLKRRIFSAARDYGELQRVIAGAGS